MDQPVQVWRAGRAGRIRLNRPKALHALDLEMVQLIRSAVVTFGADPTVHVLVLDAPERGFCAGGDVRTLRERAQAGDEAAVMGFFREEYAMNQAIADLRKPYVSLINGVCMGGGIGVSVHGSHRIAGEKAMFAMPETAIALFPDVGASYALPRLPGALGMYMGLTGARILGADAVHAGLATHYVPGARFEALGAAIEKDGVTAVAEFTEPLPAFALAAQRGAIDAAFSAGSVAEIFARLEADGSDFAAETLATLRTHSPSAICWSFEILRRGAVTDLHNALAAELRLVRHVAMGAEFVEGVRAALVDKDKSPKWHPPSVEEVDLSKIAKMFET